MVRHCWVEVVSRPVFSCYVDFAHVDFENSGFVLVGVELEDKYY